MNYASSDNDSVGTTLGLCPNGWHLPTHHEITTIERAVCTGSNCATDFPYNFYSTGWHGSDEGGMLKDTGTIYWNSPNTGATNSSHFSALAGGVRYGSTGNFDKKGINLYFWSSSENNRYEAWRRPLATPMHQYTEIQILSHMD